MTARHMVEGIMQATNARSQAHCAVIVGLDSSHLHYMTNGRFKNPRISTVDLIHIKTGIPLDLLFAWHRLPEGAVLGRAVKINQQGGV